MVTPGIISTVKIHCDIDEMKTTLCTGIVPQLGHDNILAHCFQVIICLLSYHLAAYSLNTKSVVE